MPTSGWKPGAAARGFTHTTRWARRRSRAIARASSSGGSLSQPSDPMTTIPPRTALPWCEASSSVTLAAIRVPPNRSVTRSVASATASSADLCRSTGVRRVSLVAKANVSPAATVASARIRWK